jgi:hypothetical protein
MGRTLILFILTLTCAGLMQPPSTLKKQAAFEPHVNLDYEDDLQTAIQVNNLAGNVHSDADALALVNAISDTFADVLPPSWRAQEVRQRVAHAEYAAVSNSSQAAIPEQRIADAWNEYVANIGASDEATVTAVEIHSMRDGIYTFSKQMWTRHNRTVWTMPNIFAVGPNGKIADGCRAIEALRIIYDLDRVFDNLRSARARLRSGVTLSDEIKEHQKNTNQKGGSRLEGRADSSPLRPAEYRFIRRYGPDDFNQLFVKLFDELFPLTR